VIKTFTYKPQMASGLVGVLGASVHPPATGVSGAGSSLAESRTGNRAQALGPPFRRKFASTSLVRAA
jgi:hypothetical protein